MADPDLTAIRSALTPVIGDAEHRVRLQKTTAEWMEATWSPHIGLQLQYRAAGRLWADPVPYLSPRRATRILRSYGRGLSGWQHMVGWRPVSSPSPSPASSPKVRFYANYVMRGKEHLRRLNAHASAVHITLTVLGLGAMLFYLLMQSTAMQTSILDESRLLATCVRYGIDGLEAWYVHGPYLTLQGLSLALHNSVRYVYSDHLEHAPDPRIFHSGVATCAVGLLIMIAHLPTPG